MLSGEAEDFGKQDIANYLLLWEVENLIPKKPKPIYLNKHAMLQDKVKS
jgi:hypothetical protein